jgi:branched-chain amino acid transport system permease protein
MDFAGFPQFVAGGLAIGAVYGLVGAGFSLVFNATKVINLAQGETVVIGGLATVSFLAWNLPLPAAIAGSLALSAILGALTCYVLWTARRGATELTFVMVTLGIAIAARGVASKIWGTEFQTFALYPSGAVTLAHAAVSYSTLGMLAVTALVSVALWLLLHRTLMGKAIRACGDNPLAAQTVGIKPRRMVLCTYVVGAMLGGLAGILVTPSLMMSYDNGVMLTLKGFTAAAAGGLLNPFGAVAGGLMIGVIEGICVGMISSELQNAYAFVTLLFVLTFMPQGLFGGRQLGQVR